MKTFTFDISRIFQYNMQDILNTQDFISSILDI